MVCLCRNNLIPLHALNMRFTNYTPELISIVRIKQVQLIWLAYRSLGCCHYIFGLQILQNRSNIQKMSFIPTFTKKGTISITIANSNWGFSIGFNKAIWKEEKYVNIIELHTYTTKLWAYTGYMWSSRLMRQLGRINWAENNTLNQQN